LSNKYLDRNIACKHEEIGFNKFVVARYRLFTEHYFVEQSCRAVIFNSYFCVKFEPTQDKSHIVTGANPSTLLGETQFASSAAISSPLRHFPIIQWPLLLRSLSFFALFCKDVRDEGRCRRTMGKKSLLDSILSHGSVLMKADATASTVNYVHQPATYFQGSTPFSWDVYFPIRCVRTFGISATGRASHAWGADSYCQLPV
jgi:hypothetical protein